MPSSRSRTSEPISDLAAFVLGLVWQHGPCTAYAVRRLLLDSPSAQWSGSAGAIYPLLERLTKRGLVARPLVRGDARRRRELTVTPEGRRELKRWIGPPLGGGAITVTADPLRSRARFLGLLTPRERAVWLEAASEALEEVMAVVRRWDSQYGETDTSAGGRYLKLLTRHAELETAARKAWLREIRSAEGGG
jgi:DNA-binding PadR family transcriptional regulator